MGDVDSQEPFFIKVIDGIIQEFKDKESDSSQAMQEATHFFIGIRCPQESFSQEHEMLLRASIAACRGANPPDVTIITNEPQEGLANGYFIAAMK